MKHHCKYCGRFCKNLGVSSTHDNIKYTEWFCSQHGRLYSLTATIYFNLMVDKPWSSKTIYGVSA